MKPSDHISLMIPVPSQIFLLTWGPCKRMCWQFASMFYRMVGDHMVSSIMQRGNGLRTSDKRKYVDLHTVVFCAYFSFISLMSAGRGPEFLSSVSLARVRYLQASRWTHYCG